MIGRLDTYVYEQVQPRRRQMSTDVKYVKIGLCRIVFWFFFCVCDVRKTAIPTTVQWTRRDVHDFWRYSDESMWRRRMRRTDVGILVRGMRRGARRNREIYEGGEPNGGGCYLQLYWWTKFSSKTFRLLPRPPPQNTWNNIHSSLLYELQFSRMKKKNRSLLYG